eukprot:Nitzschia sp. Nitz4//scaffold66_size103028//19911//20693//NITZ4_004492-RA/size103028-snap-gene-0.135-mRNA-1//-1//CDS//3329556332//2714//frame0
MAFIKEEWMLPTPYKGTGWWYLLVQFIAVLFFMLAAFKCFLTVDKTDDYKVFYGYWGAESVAIATAMGRGNDNNYCSPWDKDTKEALFDGSWKFGRVVGIIGALICLPFSLLAFYILVFPVQRRVFAASLAANVTMAVLSLLLLVGLGSVVCEAVNCKIGPGSYLALVDFLFWLGAAYLSFQLMGLAQIPEDDEEYVEPPAPRKKVPALPPSENKPLPALPPSETLSRKV